METPTNRQELKRAIYDAWGRYIGTLKTLLDADGYDTSRGWGIAAAHNRLGQPAADAYLKFQTDQAAIQHRFGQFFDSPTWSAERMMISPGTAQCRCPGSGRTVPGRSGPEAGLTQMKVRQSCRRK